MKFQLFEYDVWGNAKEGFQVNDFFRVGEYELSGDEKESEILELIEAKKGVVIDHTQSSDTYIEFVDRKNGKPCGSLRMVYER